MISYYGQNIKGLPQQDLNQYHLSEFPFKYTIWSIVFCQPNYMIPSHSSKRSSESFFSSNNFCSYCKIRHRGCRKYWSSPIQNHMVSLINKFIYTKISTFVLAFCSLYLVNNVHGFDKSFSLYPFHIV